MQGWSRETKFEAKVLCRRAAIPDAAGVVVLGALEGIWPRPQDRLEIVSGFDKSCSPSYVLLPISKATLI